MVQEIRGLYKRGASEDMNDDGLSSLEQRSTMISENNPPPSCVCEPTSMKSKRRRPRAGAAAGRRALSKMSARRPFGHSAGEARWLGADAVPFLLSRAADLRPNAPEGARCLFNDAETSRS